MAVGRVVFIAGFAAVSLRVGVLAASGPGVVIIADRVHNVWCWTT